MYDERTRRRLRTGAVTLLVLGVLSLVVGITAARTRFGTTEILIPAGERVRVPPAAAFGGTVALYGTPSTGTAPSAAELGCRLLDRSGQDLGGGALSATGATRLDRKVVGDDAVLPLLRVRRGAGSALLECSGPGADRSRPMYLISSPGSGAMVPMAAFSLATLALVLGVAGTLTLRHRE